MGHKKRLDSIIRYKDDNENIWTFYKIVRYTVDNDNRFFYTGRIRKHMSVGNTNEGIFCFLASDLDHLEERLFDEYIF